MMKTFDRSFYRELFRLALPITFQSLLVSTLGVADVMMVGALGDKAVAAVGLGAKMHFVTLLFIFGFGNACSVLVSQYVGANQFYKIKQVLALTLLTAAGMLIPVVILFGVSPEIWLSAISQDPEVVALTSEYLVITALVVLLMVGVMGIETVLRALGQTSVPLVMAAISIFVNVALNYALIFGKWGFPAMGVAGAAWATLISRVIQLLLMLAYLYFPRHAIALGWEDFRALNDRKIWTSFWHFALPVAFNFVLWGFGSSIYHMIASRMGTEPLAVMSVMAPVESIIISTFIGFSGAASILLGRALGADNFTYAWELKKFFIRYGMVFGAICGGLMWLSKDWLLSPFSNLDAETYRMVEQVFLVMCLLVWIKIHNMMAMVSILRAGGDTVWCLKIDVTSMWLIGLPITAIAGLVWEWAFVWVYLAMYVEEAVKLIGSHWRMYQKKWLRNLTEVVSSTSQPESRTQI